MERRNSSGIYRAVGMVGDIDLLDIQMSHVSTFRFPDFIVA